MKKAHKKKNKKHKKHKKEEKDERKRHATSPREAKPKASRKPAAVSRPVAAAARADGVGAALRAIDERIASRERRIEEAKRDFERAAKELREVVAVQAVKVEPGPRRFRSTPARSREIQRSMADLAVEMRILAARRAELQWMQQLLGEKR
jgi:hypothetical protein